MHLRKLTVLRIMDSRFRGRESDVAMDNKMQAYESTVRAARNAGISFTDASPPSQRVIAGDDCELSYIDWGASADKPAIVFLHGFLQQARSWDFTCLALRDRFSCFALDLRGHGDSGSPDAPDFTTHHYHSDLVSLVNHLRDSANITSFSICGLSLGGQLAYLHAAAHPDAVDSIVVVDVAPELNREARRGVRRFIDALPRSGTFDALVERVTELSPLRTADAVRGSLERAVNIDADGSWQWKHDPRLFDYHRVSYTSDELWAALGSVVAPTLFVLGKNSRMVAPETVEHMTRAVPASMAVHVPNASHRVPGDNPIGFLNAVTPFFQTHLLAPESDCEATSR